MLLGSMKTARSSTKKMPSQSRSASRKTTAAGLLAFFVLGSLTLGFLIWRINNTASLAAQDASANQKNIIKCSNTVRESFEKNLRIGQKFRVGGGYPQGVFANNGALRLRAHEGKDAQLLFMPQIKGNFVFQTNFAGINKGEGEMTSFADIIVHIGDEAFVARTYGREDNARLQMWQKTNQSDWKKFDIAIYPKEFKFRLLRRQNKILVMTKEVNSKDPFKVVFQHDLAEPEGLGKITLSNNFTVKPGESANGLTSTARFRNFRVFCPSEIENEWVKDDEL